MPDLCRIGPAVLPGRRPEWLSATSDVSRDGTWQRDEFGTVPAVERLLAYFSNIVKMHHRISPDSIGERAIGHFGFFNSRFERKLWQVPLQWLKFVRLPAGCPGVLITPDQRSDGHAEETAPPITRSSSPGYN